MIRITRNRQNNHRDNKSSRRGRCRTAVESIESSLERWNSTDGVETVHNNTYMETEGDKRECSQYRSMSLLSQSSKVFARVLEKRIRYIVEPQLSENQFGFRKSKGCSDAIFIFKTTTKEAHWVEEKSLYGFHRSRESIRSSSKSRTLEILEEQGILVEVLRAVQSLYVCSQAAVRTREGETDWFEVKCGLRQGCVLSPLIFIIFHETSKPWRERYWRADVCRWLSGYLVLTAEDQGRLQDMVSNLDQQCKNYGMRISRDNTEVMVTSREPIQCDIELDGESWNRLRNSGTLP